VILLILLAGGIAVWAWKSGQVRALRFGDVAAAVAALCGIRLFGHGEAPLGIAALAGAGWWAWLRTRSQAAVGEGPAPSLADARSILDVPVGADRATIEQAHRRIIGRVHPDLGGSTELARRVNGARDILIDALERQPRAS
jgi:DnaJ family protein C protein 19